MAGPTMVNHYCEEVAEQFVVCNSARYILDSKDNNSLKRDMKKIEQNLVPTSNVSDGKAVPK
ncbi:MAG: hypothetical protein H7336_13815 [Bacteriovorax sp.]|nr:hypothetical protein [Bacteriovorax sp.]